MAPRYGVILLVRRRAALVTGRCAGDYRAACTAKAQALIKGPLMKLMRILAVVLILLGISSLFYHSFSYTTSRQTAEIGSLELSVKETEQFSVPAWLGWMLIASGCCLLLIPRRS